METDTVRQLQLADRHSHFLTFLRLSAISFAFLFSAIANDLLEAQMKNSPPLIVAHRGSSAAAPENTMAAFQLAWRHQADAIEGDFFLTVDKQIVALHDRSTERTAGINRDVKEETLANLKQLDVGSWKGQAYAQEKIPTLEEVVAQLPVDKRLILEVKDTPELIDVLKGKCNTDENLAKTIRDRVTIIAFDDKVIERAKQVFPQTPALWLTSFKVDPKTQKIRPSIEQIISTLKRIKADGLDCQASEHIDADFVQNLRTEGFEFHIWTVDDPQVACRFIDLGVDSITTNVPHELRQVCQENLKD